VVVGYPCPDDPRVTRTHTIDLGQRDLVKHLEECPDSEPDGFMLDTDLKNLRDRMETNRIALDRSCRRRDEVLLEAKQREEKLEKELTLREDKIKHLSETIKVNDAANATKLKVIKTEKSGLEMEIEALKGKLSYMQGNREERLETKRTELEHSKLESSDRKASYSENTEKYKMLGTAIKVGLPAAALLAAYLVGNNTKKATPSNYNPLRSSRSTFETIGLVAKCYFAPVTLLFG